MGMTRFPEVSEGMLGELVPVGGGDPIPLTQARLLVGRRSRCDIFLDFPNVSSQHCELEMESGYWQVRDLRSTNGVKVNGQRVEVQVLMPGDTLTIATMEFEVVYQPTTDGRLPTWKRRSRLRCRCSRRRDWRGVVRNAGEPSVVGVSCPPNRHPMHPMRPTRRRMAKLGRVTPKSSVG